MSLARKNDRGTGIGADVSTDAVQYSSQYPILFLSKMLEIYLLLRTEVPHEIGILMGIKRYS